jgi:hypothetical protein
VTSKNLRHAPLRRIALPCAKLLMQMFCGLGSKLFWRKIIRQKFTKKEDGKKDTKGLLLLQGCRLGPFWICMRVKDNKKGFLGRPSQRDKEVTIAGCTWL